MSARSFVAFGCVAALTLAATGCRKPAPAPSAADAAAPPVTSGGATASKAQESVALDFLSSVDQCTFGHDGPLLDFGETGLRVRGSQGEELRPERVEREGASFARIREKSISVPFYVSVDEERAAAAAATAVTTRIRGGVAKSVSVFVNGKGAGTFKLAKNETTVSTVSAPAALLTSGLNELTLRFQIPPRAEREVTAEIDWVHLGAGEPEKNFAAPTVRDVVLDRALGGRLEKAFALHAGSTVRCMGFLPAGATMEVDLAAEGAGEVEVEARLLRDRVPPAVIGRATVTSHYTPQRFAIGGDAQGGGVGAIELAVVRASKNGRALLGSPRVVVPPSAQRPASEPMRGVVLVVFGTVEPRSLVPYGGAVGIEGFAPLAREGTVFTLHRSSSTLPSAALGAMLTGRGPRALRLEDEGARLPAAITTVADAARQAGLVTAYFTGNPMTVGAYGFDRSWETQGSYLPDVDATGVRAFDEAINWLRARKDERFFLVVHARGGHPPWSATPDQIKAMAPPNYAGGLDPKHAGELLAKARHVPPLLRFTDADRTRAFALHTAAVAEQDRALGRLLAELRAGGRDEKTLVVVTGDVGVSTAVNVPFGDGEAPTEQLLATPLVVRGKGLFPAGATVASPTADVDLAKTMLGALGLPPPASFDGVDLAAVAAAPSSTMGRSRFATVLGRHSLRWGSLVLESSDRRELLCDVALEPLCTTDVRPTHPLSLLVLGRKLAQEKAAPSVGGVNREPAVVDPRVQAALRAWGR